MSNTRKVTSLLIDMMEHGVLDPHDLALLCLNYMSEADVADMARLNDLNDPLEEEEDKEEEEEEEEG